MQGLFLRVLNLSITASYIVLAVLLMRLALRRAPRWIHCALWALVAVRLVCPFSLQSAVSLIPSAETVSPAIIETQESPDQPIIQTGFEAIDERANAALENFHLTLVSIDPEDSLASPSQPSKLFNIITAASALWLVGAAVMALYGLASYFLLRRRVATAVRWEGNLWQCETVDTPFVLGLFRPRVYLPFHMDWESARHVIAHEQAHIARRDQWTKLMGYALLSIHWFNPFMWLAYILLGKDVELACDEKVIRDLSPEARQRYALALLDWGVNRPAVAACPLAFGEVGVKERIKRVMKYKRPALWAIALALILTAAAAVCLWTSPMAEAIEFSAAPEVSATVTPAPPTPGIDPAGPGTRFTETVHNEDGSVIYNINASVPDVPAEPIPILQIRPRDITVEEAQDIVHGLLGDTPVYEYSYERTKAEIEPILADLRGWLQEFYDDFEGRVDYYHDAAHGMTREEAVATARRVQVDFEGRLAAMEALYETASDAVEPQLCAWEFHPESYYSDPSLFSDPTLLDAGGHQKIEAIAYFDSIPYHISVCNKDAKPGDNYRVHNMWVWPEEDSSNLSPNAATVEFTREQIDGTLEEVTELLRDMGLDNYRVAYYSSRFYDNTGLIVTALPVYDETQLVYPVTTGAINADLPSSYGGSNSYSEVITFEYNSPGKLDLFQYEAPHDVVASRDTESLISFDEVMKVFRQSVAAEAGVMTTTYYLTDERGNFVLDAFGNRIVDAVEETPWNYEYDIGHIFFGYVRLPIGDGTGDYQLHPAYFFMDKDIEGHLTPAYIISALDGSVLTESSTPADSITESSVANLAVTRIAVYLDDDDTRDFISGPDNGFAEQRGDVFLMRAGWYPLEIDATPEWYAETDGVVELAPDGMYCTITLVGDVGTGTYVHVRVQDMDEKFYVYING